MKSFFFFPDFGFQRVAGEVCSIWMGFALKRPYMVSRGCLHFWCSGHSRLEPGNIRNPIHIENLWDTRWPCIFYYSISIVIRNNKKKDSSAENMGFRCTMNGTDTNMKPKGLNWFWVQPHSTAILKCFDYIMPPGLLLARWTRFSSGPLAHPELSTNSALLSLCWSQFTMLPSYNSLCDSEQYCLLGCFPSYNSLCNSE